MSAKVVMLAICLVLVGSVSAAVLSDGNTEPEWQDELTRFASYQELQDFMKKGTETYVSKQGGWAVFALRGGAETLADSSAGANGGYSVDYSETNIQVEGVDEADIVKTDGEFIYLVSGKKVYIVKAYPAEEAVVLSEIELDENAVGLFIQGSRLIVLEERGWMYLMERYEEEDSQRNGEPSVPQTSIKVYDVSDKGNPVLQREATVDGCYVGSRMIGDYVYAIINDTADRDDSDDDVSLPSIDLGGGPSEIPASQIYRCSGYDHSYMFATIIAINTQDDGEEPTHETLLTAASSSIYVSTDNIYITSTRWLRTNGSEVTTAVHRINIEGGNIDYQASGEVPGSLLNQFSMDEYRGVFRVATTVGWASGNGEATSRNNVYTLDMHLDIIGELEDLAPGESIYSARFMGERCYLVTFKKIDPLFVIDLHDPYSPKVLGELKITGYSDYLHPYDEDHVIGIGKEAVAATEGDFAWYQGVKISLFDVSDVTHPEEITKYEIGDRGTDSAVLRDHKAFLFDRDRELLVMPVLLAEIDESDYPYGVPDYAYGEYVWQGAYVFSISLEDGLQLRGRITHYDGDDDLSQEGYYYFSPESVQRSLYIDDALYTISEAKVKINGLETLDEIGEVQLS
jgi:inhibitor of cysteine peptidase